VWPRPVWDLEGSSAGRGFGSDVRRCTGRAQGTAGTKVDPALKHQSLPRQSGNFGGAVATGAHKGGVIGARAGASGGLPAVQGLRILPCGPRPA